MDRPSLGPLIRQARARAGLKQDDLARQVGCTGAYVTMLEKGRSLPSPQMAIKLERALRLRSGALLRRVLALRLQDSAALARAVESAEETPPASRETTRVPLLDAGPASPSAIPSAEAEEWIELPKAVVRGRRMYLLRVTSDGMDRAGLGDGDLVLVDAEAAPRHGEIVVTRVKRDTLIRRFLRSDSKVTLMPQSTNPALKPLLIRRPAEAALRGVVEAIYLKRLK